GKPAQDPITDDSFGKLLPEVVISGTSTSYVNESEEGFIPPGGGINYAPEKIIDKARQQDTTKEPSKTNPKEPETGFKIPFIGRVAGLTLSFVLSPLAAGKGSDAETYLQGIQPDSDSTSWSNFDIESIE